MTIMFVIALGKCEAKFANYEFERDQLQVLIYLTFRCIVHRDDQRQTFFRALPSRIKSLILQALLLHGFENTYRRAWIINMK